MQVEALLADSVVTADGKIFVQGGGWDTINAMQLPTRHPRIGLALLIRVPYTETNRTHSFEVRLEDADGRPHPLGDAPVGVNTKDGRINQLVGQFVVGRPPLLAQGDDQIVPIAINLDGLVFENSGQYRFVISINDQTIRHIPFRINTAPVAAPMVR